MTLLVLFNIGHAALYAPTRTCDQPSSPAGKQEFATQVRALNLEAHDHNADNELGFTGAFSTDATNRSHWLPACCKACGTRSTVSDSQPLRTAVFFAKTFRLFVRNTLKASFIFSLSDVFDGWKRRYDQIDVSFSVISQKNRPMTEKDRLWTRDAIRTIF